MCLFYCVLRVRLFVFLLLVCCCFLLRFSFFFFFFFGGGGAVFMLMMFNMSHTCLIGVFGSGCVCVFVVVFSVFFLGIGVFGDV